MKKKWINILVASLVFFAFCSPLLAAWEADTKKLFEKDKYDKVIEIAENHKKDKDSKLGLMMLAFSHLQLSEFNATKSDKKAFKNYMELLEDYVNATHLDDISYFINQIDKPEVVNQARKLLKKAFSNISNIEDAPLILNFVKVEDEQTRKMAVSALDKMIATKRKYVNKGGTLREKDILILQDEGLIRALLENADISDAFGALEDIEQPVLQYIGDYEGGKILKLEEKILKAITKREKKFPESNWYSATGKAREVAE